MRKILGSSVVVLMAVFLSAGLGLAGNGQGGGKGGSGNCEGTGISIVCSGNSVTIEGTVSDVSYSGNGLIVVRDEETYEIYGIGPYWYWENSDIGSRPELGEDVFVEGMEVTFSDGSTKIIAMVITVDGNTIGLREECVDGVGGWPLWRGSKGKRN